MVLPAILGGLATGAGSSAVGFGLQKLFGGGTESQFKPSELMQAYEDYALANIEVPRWQKKADRAQFRNYVRTGDRGAAEDYFRSRAELYPDEPLYSKKLAKSLKKDVDFGGSQGFSLADQIYTNAGLPLNAEDFTGLAEQAKSRGIRGSAAFGDFLKGNLLAQGKIMSPMQEQLSYIFGAPKRVTEGEYAGRYTNDYMWNRG